MLTIISHARRYHNLGHRRAHLLPQSRSDFVLDMGTPSYRRALLSVDVASPGVDRRPFVGSGTAGDLTRELPLVLPNGRSERHRWLAPKFRVPSECNACLALTVERKRNLLVESTGHCFDKGVLQRA